MLAVTVGACCYYWLAELRPARVAILEVFAERWGLQSYLEQ